MPFNPLSWLTSPPAPAPAPAPATAPAAAAPPPSPPPPTTLPPTETTPAAAATPRPTEARRHLKQLTLLLSGSAFLALSILTTRRTLAQRRLSLLPPFYHPNTRPPLVPPNGALDALQALNLATLNTTAFAIFLVGGGMVALDVCTLEELRERARGTAAVGEAEREAEEEFEEWLVGVLARKEKKEEVRRRVKEEMEMEREREREKAGGGR